MRPYSTHLRLRIHEARHAGESTAEVAERFGVSTTSVTVATYPLQRLEPRSSPFPFACGASTIAPSSPWPSVRKEWLR